MSGIAGNEIHGRLSLSVVDPLPSTRPTVEGDVEARRRVAALLACAACPALCSLGSEVGRVNRLDQEFLAKRIGESWLPRHVRTSLVDSGRPR